MIIHDVEQGSPAWISLRLGIPTASAFDKIITPTWKLSTQATSYACFLIAQELLNVQLDNISDLEWVARGKAMEDEAADAYTFIHEKQIKKIGFVTTDCKRIGASPDRLIVGEKGGLEIKCPAPQTHIRYMLEGVGNDYKCQVQGQMWVAELDYVDFFSYHPQMPPVLIRTLRDEDFIGKMSMAILQFVDMKAEMLQKAKSKGDYIKSDFLKTSHDQAYKEEETK